MRRIYSIRGGGIRGIIPACCLIELEQQLGGVTRDHVDMIAGCSTGALLTGAVAAGIPATELLKVYTDRSKEIFTPTGALATVKRGLLGYMYNPKNLYKVLKSVYGAAATWTINECPIRVLICATGVDEQNWFFVRDNPVNRKLIGEQLTGEVRLIDAAVASACAPTYFNYWPVTINGKKVKLFDGGVGGNANPSHQACVEAFDMDDFDPLQTRLFDLGTGTYTPPKEPAPPEGILNDVGYATNTLVDNSESQSDHDAREKWPGVITTLNPPLPYEIAEDDLSTIPTLVKIGQEFAQTIDWKTLLAL